nr:histidine kinase [Gramella crocea]
MNKEKMYEIFQWHRGKIILLHLLAWLALGVVNYLPDFLILGTYTYGFPLTYIGYLVLFYFNYLFLVPQFLLKQRINFYVITAVLLVTISVLFGYLMEPLTSPLHILRDSFSSLEISPLFKILTIMRIVVINLAFLIAGTTIRLYKEWVKNRIREKEVEQQKALSELEFLKNQLNPHFLFNSLNSIYSLAQKKSPYTPEAIIALSELMRYMLYETNHHIVLLEKELNYIRRYIQLQRLRLMDSTGVNLQIRGEIANQKIKPLILISFIENAFKHGINEKGNSVVKIQIKVNNNQLNFYCSNFLKSQQSRNNFSGIGLTNSKKRLELLYPNAHTFEVIEGEGNFIVNLSLNLDC